MPNLLSDPPFWLYMALTLATLVAGFVWVRSRTRPSLIILAVFAGLLALVALMAATTESPREVAVRKVQAMATAVNARNWNEAFSHISEQFTFRGQTKPAFRKVAESAAASFNPRLHFTAFDKEQVEYRPDGSIKIGFVGQVESPVMAQGRGVAYIEAVFAREPDGELRMRSLEVYEYIARKNTQNIPGIP